MTEQQLRHHGLESFLQGSPGDSLAPTAISVAIQAGRGHINLRGNPHDAAFVASAEKTLGQMLPIAANTFTEGKHRVYWLSPDEWLIVVSTETSAELCGHLAGALKGQHAAVNELSGGQVVLRLSGPDVEQILTKGSTLDLHSDIFPTGACAQSGLAKANVLVVRADDNGAFDIIVRRSFSDYLLRWITHAAKSVGVCVTVE